MARRKGRVEDRKVRRGPNKGQTAKLVTIRQPDGDIRHSYRPYSSAAYRAKKRKKKRKR